ncbi:DUF3320 domain-containing protein [Duganella sp. FT92W]|uniref:DUF3320 domain-containing protein n=2 Tax=Pseudoduganella rivuli TaxID=2666085 RepID=A0A7X2IU16_9BURK|nr:DUF3320 domain-containing protein [Pseudoduganella rivuli]
MDEIVNGQSDTAVVQPPHGKDKPALARLFDDARKRLVETGTRNRLVHVNRQSTRGNVINIVNERSDDIYAILSSGKAMRFLAIGKDTEPDDLRLAGNAEQEFDTERYTDSLLETRLGPDALQKRLLKIAREAQTAEEESGVNVLYLALGFLTWFEDKASAMPRSAPLVLLPVQLVRNQRTSTYDLRLRDEDLVTNLPLQQRLKDDFGLTLPELETDEGWTPAAYFDQIASVISHHANWEIEHDGMQLGFFSFSKLLMYRDLSPDAWPDGALTKHGLTQGLLYEGFASESPLIRAEDRLDDLLPPEKIFHVVDADASQAIVIEEVRQGRNLVVQGPPGTGKSQTITNIIAAAVREGRRVLFVAEKMAALSVVHERLVKVGLKDICLELHSRTANKKAVLAELAHTIAKSSSATPAMPGAPTELTQARDRLNLAIQQLHRPIGVSGETPFSVMGTQSLLIGRQVPAPSIGDKSLTGMASGQVNALIDVLNKYGELLSTEGHPDAHPFVGIGNLDLQPTDLSRLTRLLDSAIQRIEDYSAALSEAAGVLGVDFPLTAANGRTLAETLTALCGLPADETELALQVQSLQDIGRLRQIVEAGVAWRTERDAARALFVDSAFETSPLALRGALAEGAQSFFARWFGAYRGASRQLAGMLRGALPKTAAERLALLDSLLGIHALKARWKTDDAYCAQSLGSEWRGEMTDFMRLRAVLVWCEQAQHTPIPCGPVQLLALASQREHLLELLVRIEKLQPHALAAIDEVVVMLRPSEKVFAAHREFRLIASWMRGMSASMERYPGWVALQAQALKIDKAGIPDIGMKMRAGTLLASDAANEVRYARAEALWNMAREASPLLREIVLQDRHRNVSEFVAYERAHLKNNVTSIVAGHLAQVPQGAMGEMKVIRGEIGKKRGHIALRKLFATAGTALQRIKPVMLMSPISVAQYLPPGALTFDLLVIDEASQVRPEEALGAITRAAQIVVVGDQKQLPPSSFFDRLLSDEVDEAADEDNTDELLGSAAKVGAMESILSLCEARGLNSRMLQWHYRSRDPSLIHVSNREFYGDKLILPPSPLQSDPAFGLKFTRVDGVYDKGGKRDNRLEGEAIVRRVAEHARNSPDTSLGIVTFSSAQRNLISELLELHRRSDRVLDDFLRDGCAESVFVKNIENVQGDERDVILVSVCYGPVIAGGRLTSMSFGPVNGEGGERRLNVLFTRARLRCEVFASFDPADIDPSRTSRDGVRILKHYLDYASGAALAGAYAGGGGPESPFEEDVANVVESLGYLPDAQVGASGFRIDLGVRHADRPGSYLLAVECDGATYHSALWARERDRLRQDVLEHLGWRFHRIWSTDWFYNRKAEIERLRRALDEAKAASEAAIAIKGANAASADSTPLELIVPSVSSIPVLPEIAAKQMPPYKRCVVAMGPYEPHEIPTNRLAGLVIRIVREEGPIHYEEAARRVASSFGKEKAGVRIVSATKAAFEMAQALEEDVLSDGDFWFTKVQLEAVPVRDRAEETGATVKAANISMLEIRAALAIARTDNAGGADAELIRSAARLLGFKRVGGDLQDRLAAGLAGG